MTWKNVHITEEDRDRGTADATNRWCRVVILSAAIEQPQGNVGDSERPARVPAD